MSFSKGLGEGMGQAVGMILIFILFFILVCAVVYYMLHTGKAQEYAKDAVVNIVGL